MINLSDAPYGLKSCACPNCNWRGEETQLNDVEHLYERIGRDGFLPSGECPKCGALVHVDTEKLRAGVMAEDMLMILRDVLDSTKDKDMKARIRGVFSKIFKGAGVSRHQFNLVAGKKDIANYMNDSGGKVFDSLTGDETKYIFKMAKRGRREDAIREIIQRKKQG